MKITKNYCAQYSLAFDTDLYQLFHFTSTKTYLHAMSHNFSLVIVKAHTDFSLIFYQLASSEIGDIYSQANILSSSYYISRHKLPPGEGLSLSFVDTFRVWKFNDLIRVNEVTSPQKIRTIGPHVMFFSVLFLIPSCKRCVCAEWSQRLSWPYIKILTFF